MHEMGLIDAILKTVEGVKEREELSEIYSITLEVGELSGAVPRFLKDCYEAAAAGTPYENVELRIVTVPGVLRCGDCEIDFPADIEDLRCPRCRGVNLTPLTGRELTIAEIEAS